MDNTKQTSELPRLTIIGKPRSATAYMIRDFLHRSAIPFEWIEVKNDDAARAIAGVDRLDDSRLPVCIFPDGTRLECPTIRQILEKLGWYHDPSRSEYDVAIYGAGPAGLSAAVYAASEGLKTVVIEKYTVGGQAGSTTKVENYLGFPQGISGNDLAERAREQACRFGAEILLGREGVRGQFQPGKGVVYLADGTKIIARASLCATGVVYRRLGLPNEDRFFGIGVYYGAGASEAQLCVNDDVYIVGGGNSAAQAAMHFSRYARSVVMVVRDDSLKVTVSQYLVDRIYSRKNITVLTRTVVTALDGGQSLETIILTNRDTGEQKTVPARWLFVCVGGAPNTAWAQEVGVARDEGGYLVTGPDLAVNNHSSPTWPLDRSPFYLETNMPGLFAAGDVRHGSVKRCASAVGEGAMAVTFMHRYLANG